MSESPGSVVAGLVLAAGAGRRFGMPKALVRHRGRLFVEHATGVLRSAGCSPVLAVLGASADRVRAEAELAGVHTVSNSDWASGMGSSLRAGIDALTAVPEPVAVIVLPVDTPGVTVEAVTRLTALASPDALARATYHGVPGHPALIGRVHWAAVLARATGNEGARSYFRAHPPLDVPCADVADGRDVDRPEDLPPA